MSHARAACLLERLRVPSLKGVCGEHTHTTMSAFVYRPPLQAPDQILHPAEEVCLGEGLALVEWGPG